MTDHIEELRKRGMITSLAKMPAQPEPQAAEQRAVEECPQGMPMRDYFAAKAMQGILAAQIHGFNDRPANGPFASMAYEMADAMLKAREARND